MAQRPTLRQAQDRLWQRVLAGGMMPLAVQDSAGAIHYFALGHYQAGMASNMSFTTTAAMW